MSRAHYIQNAIEIVTSFSDKRYPVDPFLICAQMGIKVKCDRPLDKDGYLICCGGKKIILVSSRISNRHRKNFIIAHELGHFLLHRDQLYSCEHISAVANQNVNSEQQEQEANDFASELLLPSQEMKKYIPKDPITFRNIEYIATRFDISKTHAAIHAITASNSEAEILICYKDQKRKWYVTANSDVLPYMVPFKCPIHLEESPVESDISGVWTTLFPANVHQELFSPCPHQYLVLLSRKD